MQTNKKLVLVFVLGLCVNLGLLWVYYMPSPKALIGDEAYYYKLASELAQGRRVQHSPLFPPLYPELMARLFMLFGQHRLVVQLPQIGLWLASAVLLYRITARLFQPPLVSFVAASFFLFSPELIAFSHYFWPETLHMFLVLAALYGPICHARRPAAWIASGLLLGLATQTKSLLWPFLPALLIGSALWPGLASARRARRVRAALVGGALVLTLLSSLLLTGGQALRGGGSGLINLWMGLTDVERVDYRNPRAGAEIQRYLDSAPDPAGRNAIYRARIMDLLSQRGVGAVVLGQLGRQYFRLFDYQTFFSIQLPGGPRPAYRVARPALGSALRWYSLLSYSLILVGGALGLALARLRPGGWIQVLLVFLAYNLGLFLLLHVKTRYTIQFLPVLIIFAAVGLYALKGLLLSEPLVAPGFALTRRRWLVGLGLALLMALLMFRSALLGP